MKVIILSFILIPLLIQGFHYDQVDEIRILLEDINISIETKLLKGNEATEENESGGFLSSIPRMLGFRRSADGARINQLEEMQPMLAPLFDPENCFDSEKYSQAKNLLIKAKEIIEEIEANNAEQIGTCFKDYLMTMQLQNVADNVQVKVLDSTNGQRIEGAQVEVNDVQLGLTNNAGVVIFEVTNCTTLTFQVKNLEHFEPFQMETQLVLPTSLQLNLRPVQRKIQVQVISDKDQIPLGNATVRIQGDTFESDIDGWVKPGGKYRVGSPVQIDAIRSGFAPGMVKHDVIANNGQDNQVSIVLNPFTGYKKLENCLVSNPNLGGWKSYISSFTSSQNLESCQDSCTNSINCHFYVYLESQSAGQLNCFYGDFNDQNPLPSVSNMINQPADIYLKQGQHTYQSANELFVDNSTFDACVQAEYAKKHKYALEMNEAGQCAALCSLACKTTCDSYLVENNSCKFLMMSDTNFGKNNGNCPVKQAKVAPSRILKRHQFQENAVSYVNHLMENKNGQNCEESGKVLKISADGIELTLNGQKSANCIFVVENMDNHELSLKVDPTFKPTKNGKVLVYSGTKDVIICSYNVRGQSSESCTWTMPIVTIEYQQGNVGAKDYTNVLEITRVPK